MAKSYAQVVKQIEALSREAEKLKQKEVDGVIARIREAVKVYGLSASDLGLSGRGIGTGKTRTTGKPAKKRTTKSKLSTAAKFRDEAGNTWVGRGPRPHWLRAALASGKQLEDFAV
jgi:DNA-binding protein H-NS